MSAAPATLPIHLDDMIYLDGEVLGNNTLAEVAQFVESRFSEYVYRAYTKDEIFSGE